MVSSTQPPQLGLPAMVVVSGRLGSPEGSSVAALWKKDATGQRAARLSLRYAIALRELLVMLSGSSVNLLCI
jgi:hypothetical protein